MARNYRVNERIRASEVRLVRDSDDNGNGASDVMSRQDALRLARESGLDVVEVGPNQSPPVVRLMDYGKFKFDLSKRAKETRKASRATSQLKKVQLTTKIAQADIEMKTKRVLGFLEDGAKVQVFVKFRGRERTHPELALDVLRKVAVGVADQARLEQAPQMEGRNLSMLLAPRSKRNAPAADELAAAGPLNGSADNGVDTTNGNGAAPSPEAAPPSTTPAPVAST